MEPPKIIPNPCKCANCQNWSWVCCLALIMGGVIFSIEVIQITNAPGFCAADMINLTKTCNAQIDRANMFLMQCGLPANLSFNSSYWDTKYNLTNHSTEPDREPNACYEVQ